MWEALEEERTFLLLPLGHLSWIRYSGVDISNRAFEAVKQKRVLSDVSVRVLVCALYTYYLLTEHPYFAACSNP